jgi:YHS domain-containing protein
MYRLLLISALVIVLYFLLRQAARGFKKNREVDGRGSSLDQDQMIEDPVCHTFVPRRTAVVKEISGRTYCFCSKECAAAFQSQQAD